MKQQLLLFADIQIYDLRIEYKVKNYIFIYNIDLMVFWYEHYLIILLAKEAALGRQEFYAKII